MPSDGILPVILENLPRFLKEFLLWCVWISGYTEPDGQVHEGPIPISPVTGASISVSDPSGWGTFEQAVTAQQRGIGAGLGILLRPENNLISISLDNVVDDEGHVRRWARSFVDNTPSYWKWSTSGSLRGFIRGTLPPSCGTKSSIPDRQIEVSCEGFLTVTGRHAFNSSREIMDCPIQLQALVELLGTRREGPSPGGTLVVQAENWPDPEELEAELLPVMRFDPDLLPENFRRFAVDVAVRLQVPLDFLGAALLVSLAGVTGRRARIRPKRFDDWEEAANLWGGIVAEPGAMKTPAAKRVLKILHRMEAEASQHFQAAMAQYLHDREEYESRKRAWKQQADTEASHGGQAEVFDEPEPQEPTCVRFVVNDATVPKLQQILAENPGGILLFRDELAGFFAMLDTKGRESDRPFYLESWSGDQPFTVDRITRGTIRALIICLSLFGGIQPNVLRRYLLGTIIGGEGDDGLLQRLQVVVYPDPVTHWENVDREPDTVAEEVVTSVFRLIASAQPEVFVARFDREAQAFFDTWRSSLEHRLVRERLPSYLKAHLAKYRGLMPRIALLCHLADRGFVPEIPLRQAQRAAAWCEYLESQIMRFYSAGSPQNLAAVLGERIRTGALGTRFTVRELNKKGWAGLTNHKVIVAVLQELEDAGWIRKEPTHSTERGGRPAEAYRVNPRVFNADHQTEGS